jgi:[acyl-carrier-protein] S-malonyltransferase
MEHIQSIPVGLLFSGQGAQVVGMGQDLYAHSAAAKARFEEANSILGYDLAKICFEGPETLLTETRVCQVALYVHGYALFEHLKAQGRLENCQLAMGLSLGELTALAVAGSFDFAQGLQVVAKRAELMQVACENTLGSMASILGGELSDVQALCAEFDIDISNINSIGQTVISGEKTRVAAAVEAAKEKGFKRVIPLSVAGAYHSRLMEPAKQGFAEFLKTVDLKVPSMAVITNVDGSVVSDPDAIKAYLASQIVSTVEWVKCMRKGLELGVKDFYECGPSKVIAGLAKRIDPIIQIRQVEVETAA